MTVTATVTATATVTGKPTLAATGASTATAQATLSPQRTATITGTLAATAEVTPSPRRTAIATSVSTTAATGTVTNTATAEVTPSPQMTVTSTVTATRRATPQRTATSAATPSPQAQAGASSVDESATTTPAATQAEAGGEELIATGERIYATNCASCHQLSGEGTAAYPALSQSELLTADDPAEAIRIVLRGRGFMPGFANTLSAEEVAAVLSYERNSWDNNASPVTVEEVEALQ
jgi:mono/diheme cytochrome c family protein